MYGKIRIIQASNKYTDQIIKRIDRVYGEYGYWVNTNKYDKDLLDIEKNYCSKKGCFWLAMHNSRLVGTIAVKPIDNQLIEIKRLYVEKNGVAQIFLWAYIIMPILLHIQKIIKKLYFGQILNLTVLILFI